MGLSYTGKSCLEIELVTGRKREPVPPASKIPIIVEYYIV